MYNKQSSFELPGKDGGTHNKDFLGLFKQIWDYLQSKKSQLLQNTYQVL